MCLSGGLGVGWENLRGDKEVIDVEGGRGVLREVGEMFGGERVLMEGGENEEVFDKIVGLMKDFKE